MGMSASQARLLSITSRLTNNEFRAQTITNSKLRLAEKSQEASQEYMDALNSKKLMYGVFNSDGEREYSNLTANTLLSYGRLKNQYSLVNANGQILLSGSDIKNYEKVDTLGAFLELYGIDYVENPNYSTAMNSLYGEKYTKYISTTENSHKYSESLGAIYNYINGQQIDGISSDDYDEIINEVSKKLKGLPADMSGIYGNVYSAIASGAPAWVEKPGDIPDFATLVTNYNSSQCYDLVVANDGGIGHMEHNLASLIWSSSGLGANPDTKITNSSGTITVDKDGTTLADNYVSITNLQFAAGQTAIDLLDGLNSCNYTSVQNMKQQIIDLYCDVINYLHTNSCIGTNTTQLKNGNYTINSTTSAKTATDLVSAWNQMYTDLAALPGVAQVERDAEMADYQNFLNEFDAWKKNILEMLTKYNQFEVPEPQIIDETDEKYQWYVNLWYRMGGGERTAQGKVDNSGYQEIDENLINNAEWLEFCFEHGVLTLEQAQFNEKGSATYPGMGQYDWVSTVYTNSSDIISQEDEVAIAIAEVKYKNRITEIENEDKKFDQDLKKLDTEHTALQTEYDSIKEVINKNVERSFKAFS